MRKVYIKNKGLKGTSLVVALFVWIALQSMIANFCFYYSYGLWLLSFLLLIFIMLCYNKQCITTEKRSVSIYLLAFSVPYTISIAYNSSIPDKTLFIELLYGVLFLLLKKDYQYKVVRVFVWSFSCVLCIALVEFILYQFFNIGIVLGQAVRNLSFELNSFKHLLFNLVINESFFIPRFQCIANEPGLIGTLCGFLLFFVGRDKTMKFPLVVIALSGIFSFSLAFYVLGLIFIASGFLNVKKLLALVSLLFVFIMIANRTGLFEDLIVSRVNVSSLEELDNRTTATFDFRFEQAWDNGQLWLGVGSNNLPEDITYGMSTANQGGNAGAKKWIFQYGFISLIVVVVGFIRIYKLLRGGNFSYYDIVFLFAFALSFYQRQTIDTCYTLLAYCAVPLGEYYNTIAKGKINVKYNEKS